MLALVRSAGSCTRLSGIMEEVFQNGNYQREANANMTAVETRKEVKRVPLVFHIRLTNRYIVLRLSKVVSRLTFVVVESSYDSKNLKGMSASGLDKKILID